MSPVQARVLVTMLALILSLFTGCAKTDPSTAQRLQASIDADWALYKERHGVPGGGLAIYIETPTGNYFASSGMDVAVDENTRFRIASNTKTFTSAAIMVLNQQGKLNLDDKIVSPIPGSADPYVPAGIDYDIPYKSDITIRQLLNHTAGVFDVTNQDIPDTCPQPYAGKNYLEYVIVDRNDPDHSFTPDELIQVVADCRIYNAAPGDRYHYSNTGYSLLAIIIERVSGAPYDRFVGDHLILPNDLVSTSVPMLAADKKIPSPYADGYLYEGGRLLKVSEDNMSGNIAEGNIISTPADLALWIRRLIRGEAGPDAASVEAMKTPSPKSSTYGLGIQYISVLGYGHTGAHLGYLSVMTHDPACDVTLVMYFNIWDYENLLTDQATLMMKVAGDARKITGY
jgi:D-alanyl-D-alanine carboxypeptidase